MPARGAGTHAILSPPAPMHVWGQPDSAPWRRGRGCRGAQICARLRRGWSPLPVPCMLWAGRSTKGPTNSLRNAHASPGPASGVKQQRRAVNVGLEWDCPRHVVPCLQPALSERFARRSAGSRPCDARCKQCRFRSRVLCPRRTVHRDAFAVVSARARAYRRIGFSQTRRTRRRGAVQ